MAQLSGKMPHHSDVTIDYENNKISFNYIENLTENKSKVLFVQYLAVLLELHVLWIFLSLLLDAVFNIGFTPKNISILLNLAIADIVVSLIATVLHLYTPLQRYMLNILPRYSEIRLKAIHGEKWKIYTSIKGKSIVVPMLDSTFINWIADNEFKEKLKKIDVVAEKYYEGTRERLCYYAIFRFSETPQKGRLEVIWW